MAIIVVKIWHEILVLPNLANIACIESKMLVIRCLSDVQKSMNYRINAMRSRNHNNTSYDVSISLINIWAALWRRQRTRAAFNFTKFPFA